MEMKTSESPNGFCSKCFGPIWFTIHLTSLNYPVHPTKVDKQHFQTWFESLQWTLPCSVCANNFWGNLQELGWNPQVHLANRHSFVTFVWRLHNFINKKLNKNVTVAWEDFTSFYEELRADDCSTESCNLKRKKGAKSLIQIVPDTYRNDQLFCIFPQCSSTEKMLCLKPET